MSASIDKSLLDQRAASIKATLQFGARLADAIEAGLERDRIACVSKKPGTALPRLTAYIGAIE